MTHAYTPTSAGPMLIGSSPDRLSDLLLEYESLVARQVPTLRDHLLPPLTPDEVESVLRQHGQPRTPELVVLYGWAGGINMTPPVKVVLPQFLFSPLESAFSRYDQDHDGVSWGADAGWLRVVADNFGPAVELTEAPVSRIHYANPEFDDEEAMYRAVSLCTLVAWWIDGLEAEAYEWDPETFWTAKLKLMPEQQVRLGWA